jgi:hypothetical protein
MNESFLLRFESGGTLMKAIEFNTAQGVVFDTHPDASPLNMAIGVQPRLPKLLDPVRRRHDWNAGEYKLAVAREDGGLRFSGADGDKKGLPAGVYDITVEVESYTFDNSAQTLKIPENGSVEVTLREKLPKFVVKLASNLDSLTAGVIDDKKSRLDGSAVRDWLTGRARQARKACLLNVLGKLRVPAAPADGLQDPLTKLLRYVFFADVDRVYGALGAGINDVLAELTAKKLWVKEGTPKAAIHRRLLDSLPRLGIDAADAKKFKLASYRQGGRNCLQIVTATAPAGFGDTTVYADIDIDLGNPLWDLAGLLVHAGELLDSGRTDHLALRNRLANSDMKDFVFYDLVAPDSVAAGAGG